MPRRYRPPDRRRKPKKQRLPGEMEVPSYGDAEAPATSPPPVAPPIPVARDPERPSQTQHIARDYSYVVTDLRRIAIIVAFIVAGLVITAILR